MTSGVVCILTAGRGTRMGQSLAWLNKALLPVGDRAAISHLIDRFGPEKRYVIGLGHLADQVRGYLEIAHPGIVFDFVDIEPVSGPGSGPGRSLLCCADAIGHDEPFFFAPCDALIGPGIDLNAPGDWVGTARVSEAESVEFCNFRLDGGLVAGIADKVRVSPEDHSAFTGVMRIESCSAFWRALAESGERGGTVQGELQVSAGLDAIRAGGNLRAQEIEWTDLGNQEAYRAELRRRSGFDFTKPGEALYVLHGRVIKLFERVSSASGRVQRARAARCGVFPEVLDAAEGFVAYRFVEGETLYGTIDHELLGRLLRWVKAELWTPVKVARDEFAGACDAFYRGKTFERLEMLEASGGLIHEPSFVDGVALPPVRDLLAGIDWDRLASGGTPVVFHGDLQFDNVLLRVDGGFTLLDWRQDFAGRLDAGDLDYDLAKMIGGIRLDYAAIKAKGVRYEDAHRGSVLGYPSCRHAEELERSVFTFARSIGRDVWRLELLVGLIHLNMAPLHAAPFDLLLRDLARQELALALGIGKDATERAAV
ncbi:MAG: NTP transferase domain-containing protein [Planctomycetota bacterium]